MRALCCLVDLHGAPTSGWILRKMLGEFAAAEESTGQLLTGPVGFAWRTRRDVGTSPAVCSPRDGALTLAFDGRLDNRAELRSRLAHRLPGPSTATDVELIAAAYETWGTETPEHLLGDFVLVLWDRRNRRLLAARDPMGVRRLHVARVGSRLCLGTEPSQILRHPAVSNELDEATIAGYLCGLLDPPERTFFRQIEALPPGHRLVAENGSVRIDRYWDIDPEHQIRYRRSEDYAEHLLETLRTAVVCRLPEGPDSVPGVTLSGGLDSSSVAALASRHLARSSRQIVASSLVFDELRECDERAFIAEMTPVLGTASRHVPADHFGFFADTPSHPDPNSPFCAWESASQALFGSLRQQGATHVLTGLGGDDLLAGDRLAYFDRLRSGDLRAVGEIVRYARSQGMSPLGPLYRCFVAPGLGDARDRSLRRLLGKATGSETPSWISPDLRQRTSLDQRLSERPKRRFRHRAHQALYESMVVRCEPLRALAWFDRRAGALGLEARHPFLDRRVLELVLAFPPGELFRAEPSKPLLRRAMAGVLPEKIRLRSDKTSLASAIDRQLRDKEAAIVEKLLADPILGELGFVDSKALRLDYRRYRTSRPTARLRTVMNAITLESWLREHANNLCADRSTSSPMTLVA